MRYPGFAPTTGLESTATPENIEHPSIYWLLGEMGVEAALGVSLTTLAVEKRALVRCMGSCDCDNGSGLRAKRERGWMWRVGVDNGQQRGREKSTVAN
jgi:hypothetical protein